MKLKPEYRLAMTGTPLMNTPLDLYGVLRWLGVETHSFFKFKQYYAVMGGFGGYEIVGYKHLDELQSDLDSVMLRRKKDDVLDLPDKVYVDELVEMLPKQAIIYKEVKAEIKSNIDMISVAPNPLAEMIRLRQATGYTGILSSEIQCSAKLDRMQEIVEECIFNNRKVVIFSNWTSITDEIKNRLSSYNPLSITGETEDTKREQYKQMFQTDDKYKIMIGTTGAMGAGITLTKASTIIFLDHPWNDGVYEQCVDRCHRIGQSEKVTIYNIMCKDTIDERIWELVKKKGKMSDVLVDNEYGKIDKATVEYLLS
jgi:SNF2 family DNA or RNA helicase